MKSMSTFTKGGGAHLVEDACLRSDLNVDRRQDDWLRHSDAPMPLRIHFVPKRGELHHFGELPGTVCERSVLVHRGIDNAGYGRTRFKSHGDVVVWSEADEIHPQRNDHGAEFQAYAGAGRVASIVYG